VISNVDDVLLISLAVTCDQQRHAVEPVLFSSCLMDGCSKRWSRQSFRPVHGNSRYEQIPDISFPIQYNILL